MDIIREALNLNDVATAAWCGDNCGSGCGSSCGGGCRGRVIEVME